MVKGRKTWFRQNIRINTKKTEKLSNERKQTNTKLGSNESCQGTEKI